MIKNNELRIGNLVNYTIAKSTFQGKITAITTNRLVVDKVTSKFMNVEGVLLDDEWLKKIGFIKNCSVYELKTDFNEMEFFNTGELRFINWTCKISINIKYVHELQNLYFGLTREELISHVGIQGKNDE